MTLPGLPVVFAGDEFGLVGVDGEAQPHADAVGHGQLAASVADDPGVISIEGFNVRYMTPENLAEASGSTRSRS